MKETKVELGILTQEIEETRDVLLEMNSFDEVKAKTLLKQIKSYDNHVDVRDFIFSSFDFYGVDYGNYDRAGSIQVNFDSLSFVENVPKLGADNQAVLTFNRDSFLTNRQSHFMTFSNSFVQALLEKAICEGQGRFSVAYFKDEAKGKDLYFQILFTLKTKGSRSLELQNFLPFSLKRIFC